jgi:hypothetical protein
MREVSKFESAGGSVQALDISPLSLDYVGAERELPTQKIEEERKSVSVAPQRKYRRQVS